MEKYGVDETKEPAEKQASTQQTCPRCGQVLRIHGSVRLCPTHGSQPFEQSDTE